MKKVLLIIVFNFIFIDLFAQIDTTFKSSKNDIQDTIITQSEIIYHPEDKVVITKDTFNLKVEGEVKAGKLNSGGNPEEGIAARNSYAEIDAGKTTTSIDISPTGAATYTVPIALPPGISGMAPQIALVYNSQSGNGVAGFGWNISGLSAITRIPATRFHDNRIGGINFDANDRYALDGQRLILKSGVYGADGAEYQTENFSNIKIISRGVTPITPYQSPLYFEVYYPDGSKAVYGNSNDSRTEFIYAITYSESAINARINYFYKLDDPLNRPTRNKYQVISKITYGGLGTNNFINSIDFVYNTPIRKDGVFMGGLDNYNDKILVKISVTANNISFRHYDLTFDQISLLNYQRLISIQEYSGDETKAFSPINFSYENIASDVINTNASNIGFTGLSYDNSEIITGDFTGNGNIDFILYPKNAKNKIYPFWDPETNNQAQYAPEINTGYFEEIFPVTWLNYNNKLMTPQGFVIIKNINSTTVKFETYSAGITNPIYYQHEKLWENAPSNGYYSECTNEYIEIGSIPRKFLSGDFNGDGLTDIIAINKPYTSYYEYLDPNCNGGGNPIDNPFEIEPYPGSCCITASYTNSSAYVQFINLDRRLNANSTNYSGTLLAPLGVNDKIYTADFNGDGKSDILHIIEGKMYVYGFNDNNYLYLLWETTNPRIKLQYSELIGDYNGDGKTDLMFPTSFDNSNYLYATFMSTGISFKKFEQNYPFGNPASYYSGGNLITQNFIANDVNSDGKADLIYFEPHTHNNASYGYLIVSVFHNIGSVNINSAPTFVKGGYKSFAINLKHHPIPIFLNSNLPNFKQEFGIISDASLNLFSFKKDLNTESQVKSIFYDDVLHQITYDALTPYANTELPLYSSNSNNQTFPNFNIEIAPGLKVVSKLTRSYYGETIKQVFGYENAVSNTEGLGFLGFGKTIRSNWYKDDDNNRLYNINITDPQLRGATTKNFTAKYPYINSNIQNTSAANSANDGATISDYITRTDYIYDTSLSPEDVFTNLPNTVKTKDLLSTTNTAVTFTYDNFKNVTSEVSDFSGVGTKTTEITYDNNLGSTYYIGRPLTKKTTATNATDVFTTEEEYTYTGYLPTQIKRKGNGTNWVTENILYDVYGNATRKGITAGGVERASNLQYDPTGRFVIKSIDVEGLETNFTQDAATGNILTTTNPYGLTNTMQYDSWGRLIQTTDYLGKNTYTSYYKSGSNILITEYDEEGNLKNTRTNALGNKDYDSSNNVNGNQVSVAYQYDAYDRQIKVSEPEIDADGTYTQWNQTTYDEYGRPQTQTSFTGKVTNITYNGLSVTVNDGTKAVTTTKNALGNVVSVTDPGGTINYNYFANGNLQAATFDGSSQTIVQDGWGRKIQLNDPSAGNYYYSYNDFGETLIETTPKGNTTYTYDSYGKVQTKRILSPETDMNYQYTYHSSTKLLSSMYVSNSDGNNTGYTYSYDAYKRLYQTIEDNPLATFTKTFTFDAFGRVQNETSTALNKGNSKTVNKTVGNNYQYGNLSSITDVGTGEIIWQVGSINARGQVTTAFLANAMMKQTNTYDQYGFAQELKTDRIGGTPAELMRLSFSFNAQRGLLETRSNSVFGWNENFTHDSQDRLTNYNDNNGLHSQMYDNKGRVSSNSKLGNYVYNASSYQQTGMNNLTQTAMDHYNERRLLQISYNAFKSPVQISEQGKEKISFQYNADQQRSHMYYGNEAVEKLDRPYRRHYSEDGNMEITEDIPNGTTSFVFYMGGDAYSAPAIWKEIHTTNNAVTQNLYYLHRDYLGSILLITDNQGIAVEQRHFDAWGNIVKLTDGNGNTLTNFLITDRGYTGHEHLLAVGIVHMNGRLYDPLLHRFLQPDNYIQFPYDSQNYNRYAYVLNNPLTHNDPSGEIIPVLVFVGAAIIGGGTNVWSNWDKIVKNPWSAVSYFASGAVGGAVSVVNPWVGGTITAASNIGIDAAYGNLPKFNGLGDIAKYVGGKALDGLGAAGAGGLSKFGYNIAGKIGWIQTVTTSGLPKIIGSGVNTFAVAGPNVFITATKVPVVGIANNAVRIAAKGGTTFFDGAKYSSKVLRQMSKTDDILHAFPKSVDGFANKFGQWTSKIGADGKPYQWLKLEGGFGGKTGTFEYIKDADGIINHRFFNLH